MPPLTPNVISSYKMHIQALYIYPIKSLRGVSVSSAILTQHGSRYDRRFLLVRDEGEDKPQAERYSPMMVSHFPEMVLFTTEMTTPNEAIGVEGSIKVTYTNPTTSEPSSITIPLLPDTSNLAPFNISLHQSPIRALRMPSDISAWFSSHFNFPTLLLYVGPRLRQTIGNLAPNAAERNPILRQQAQARLGSAPTSTATTTATSLSWKSWFPSLSTTSNTTTEPDKAIPHDPFNAEIDPQDYSVAFQDGAAYLVTSSSSLEALHDRMPNGELADMTKFRPNIVVAGGEEWEEDFWGEIAISTRANERGEDVKMILNNNCVRCTSLNADYSTGKNTTGTNLLKLLQKDRRVDREQKYSPVFGRYAWLVRGEAGGEQQGEPEFEVRIGDEVEVTRRNGERTAQKWPRSGRLEDVYPD
jgi:uncharacterized protein YcbX